MEELELYWNNVWQTSEQYRHETLMHQLKAEFRQMRQQRGEAVFESIPLEEEQPRPPRSTKVLHRSRR